MSFYKNENELEYLCVFCFTGEKLGRFNRRVKREWGGLIILARAAILCSIQYLEPPAVPHDVQYVT